MTYPDFEYNDMKFRHVEKHNYRGDGWSCDRNNISCIPKEIPECKTGIFVEI